MLDKLLGFFIIILYLIFAVICGIITIVVSVCIFIVVIPLAFILKLADMLVDDEDCF